MPETSYGITDLALWSLNQTWSTANAAADVVRLSREAAASSSFFARTKSAEALAEAELRTAQLECEQGMKGASDTQRAEHLAAFEARQRQIAENLAATRKSLFTDEERERAKIEPAARAKVYSRLVDPRGGTACDTLASRPPTVYYVIVGRGTAAVLNHTTLRQTAAGQIRMQDTSGAPLPVLHLGLPDPWFYYHAHGMGQPPFLLSLPGMHFRPTPLDRTIRGGLHSNDFSYKILQEWSLLKVKYGFEHMDGWVATIQKHAQATQAWTRPAEWDENPTIADKVEQEWKKPWPGLAAPPPFRLIVVRPDETILSVYAEKIDLCVGIPRASIQNGQPHRQAIGTDSAEALTRLWEPPEQWSNEVRHRRIVTGPEALCTMTAWYRHERHCVNGGGGIGLNMIERAEDVGNAADWMHYQTLHGSFNLARNDTVLKHPTKNRCMEPGESGLRNPGTGALEIPPVGAPSYNTIPGRARWRFARFATIEAQASGALSLRADKVRVRIKDDVRARILDHGDSATTDGTKLANGAFPFSVHYKASNPDLSENEGREGDYDRVWCTGGAVPVALGSPACMLGVGYVVTALNSPEGITIGLQAESGAIRILGAAATQHPQWGSLRSPQTGTYFDSLPLSAVLPGFIFAGVCIAEANGLFGEQPNQNANTMSEAQLREYLVSKQCDASLAGAVATNVVRWRRPCNGFATNASIEAALATSLGSTVGWREAVAHLRTDYPLAGAFND